MGSAETGPTYLSVKLKSRQEVAEGTLALRFEKPPGWTFKANQSIDVTLLDPPETDSEGNTRAFSIASAPQEDTLMVATRMRDTAFKRVLGALPLGTAVKIEGPFGNLTLHNNSTGVAVFLAGGIGNHTVSKYCFPGSKGEAAAPYFPFLFEAASGGCSVPRRASRAGRGEFELQTRRHDDPNGGIPSALAWRNWSDKQGDASKSLRDTASPIYYVAGPPGMVKGLHETLNKAGVDDDDVRTEEFLGY